jgi:ubiquitin-protein ligase
MISKKKYRVSSSGGRVSRRANKNLSKKRSMKGGNMLKRIKAELKAISEMSEPNPYISINPQINQEPNGNVTMNGVITFPPDSVYYPGNFNVKMVINPVYPFTPPIISLTTPMYHFNVSDDGQIKLKKLDRWDPRYRLYSLLSEIQNALYKFDTTENMEMVNENIFRLFNENRPEFDRIVRDHVLQYALLSHKVGGVGESFQVSTDTCKKISAKSECDKKSGCRWTGERCVREWDNPRQDFSHLFVHRGGQCVSTRAKKLVSKRKKLSMKGGNPIIRIRNEFKTISQMSEPNPYISINPQINEETNRRLSINGVITFPSDSVYYGGNFHVKMVIKPDYPFSAPIITLTTPMYHPNVSNMGEISHNKLGLWSPAYTLYSILTEIQDGLYKFDTTENMHVLNDDMYKLFTENRPEFDRIAREHVLKHAL